MRNIHWQHCLLLPLLALFLGACSVKPPVAVGYDVAPLWHQRLALLERLDGWSLDGRIAVRDGGKAWSAKLSWTQRGVSYDILIAAPFGQGAARLSGEPGRALIDISGQQMLVADDPSALLFEQVGWAVPVDALQYWLVGRPDPHSAALLEWDELGQVVRLEQGAWVVDYQRYSEDNAAVGVTLPTKVRLESRQLRVKIVIDQWHLDS